MSNSKELEELVNGRKVSREIVREILNFGVNEQQKLNVIFELALNLESHEAMKSITSAVKNFR